MRLFTPDTSFYSGYTDQGKFLLVWRLNVLFLLIFFGLSITFIFINPQASAFYSAVFVCALGNFIYLYKARKYRLAFWNFTICASVINTISLMMTSTIVHYAEFFWIVCIVIFAFIGLGRKAGLGFMIFHALAVAAHMFFFLNTNIDVQDHHTFAESMGTLIELLMALVGIAYLLNEYLKFQSYAEGELKRANEGLEHTNQLVNRKIKENLILAKEIHHRVKNNLQIVISLLRMHRDEVRSADTKRHFSEAINRIMTMSLIHEKLYQEKELSVISIDDYLRDLARAITTSGTGRKDLVELQIETEITTVGLKTIVPLGLLLNELLTNSIKHAFRNNVPGVISVTIRPCGENRIGLNYSDSGDWRKCPEEEAGFGLELIEVLVHQLDGEFIREGSSYRFQLGNLDH